MLHIIDIASIASMYVFYLQLDFSRTAEEFVEIKSRNPNALTSVVKSRAWV